MKFRAVFGAASFLFFSLPAMAGKPTGAAPAVTFNGQIAPIIYHECSECHRPGQSAPFSLLSYADVKKRAAQIAAITKARFMPPWLPEKGYDEFMEERRLTDQQINQIQQWVKEGEPLGANVKAPAPPKFTSDWALGQPDLILHVGKPYTLPADSQEVFWNFVMPVPITTTRWVKAIEVRPGNPRVFHHANVILDRSGAARRREKIPGAGFGGMDLEFEEETFDPDGHFLSWKPGADPVVEPDGMAWRADPGMDLVLNVHLRPTGKVEKIDPEVGLYFTDKPEMKFPMLVQLQHDSILDIPPGDKDFLVTDDFKVPMDLNVLAVYPHAHYLARLMEGYATLPDGTRKWLVRIQDWDLNWQGVFRLKKPMFLPKGTVVSMRYHYDNSADNVRNPNHPPKRVVGGNESTNEMSHLWLQVLPVEPGDHRAEIVESIAEQRLQKYPNDFASNYNMGDLLLGKGKAAEAIPYFQKAANTDPRSPVAATDLGVALFTDSKVADAEKQFRKALTIDPGYTDARFNLASVEASSGNWQASVADFKQVIQERPDNTKAQQRLGEVLMLWGDSLAKAGHDDQAVECYREALPYRADDPQLHGRLGMAFARMNRLDDSEAEFQAILRIKPSDPVAKQAVEAIEARKKALGK